ncbi:isochorismatase family protein [Azohydromonas caseinilytica]|uniref:Isochorismatase family protein n=1 Tax=Azohydromonas caseinilytica TaxID=2728836 RepID=A0A848F9V9_9BURK|nr:isochorismatase family protein [Azohydromonas caseinilytica]NML15535.1 isochorismatase family protein [Azohydromonas caseinilytica]
MLKMDAARSVLVLVDYQGRLMPAIHEAEAVVEAAVTLADAARVLGIRVVGTEQNPDGLGPNAEAVRGRCNVTLRKMHFDACGDGLAELLAEGAAAGERPEVVIAGCEAHVCLMQTALGLLERGFRVWVVETACGSRRPSDKQAALQRLRQAGATVVSDDMVLFEWVRSCRHPRFKAVLELVKRRGGS